MTVIFSMKMRRNVVIPININLNSKKFTYQRHTIILQYIKENARGKETSGFSLGCG